MTAGYGRNRVNVSMVDEQYVLSVSGCGILKVCPVFCDLEIFVEDLTRVAGRPLHVREQRLLVDVTPSQSREYCFDR